MQVYHDRDNFMQDTKNEEKTSSQEGGGNTQLRRKRGVVLSPFFSFCIANLLGLVFLLIT